jgi:hypothetical protein
MPKKTTESNPAAEGQTTTRRKRRTAEDILSQTEPKKAGTPKTLAEELAEEPKVRRTRTPRPKAQPEPIADLTPTEDPKPRRQRQRRETPVEANPEPKFRTRKSEPTTQPEEKLLQDSTPTPRFRARKPETTKKPTKEVIDTDGIFTLAWRPRAVEANDSNPTERPASKPSTKTVAKTTLADSQTITDEAGLVSIVAWRSTGTPPQATEPANQDSSDLAPRRTRTRRRADRQDVEITAKAAYRSDLPEPVFRTRNTETEPEPVVINEPEPPAAPVRLPIARSEDAAQVAFHRKHPTIIKERRAYSPIIFFADLRTPEQRQIVLDELKEAYDQGIRLFSFLLEVTVDQTQTQSAIDFALQSARELVKVAPEVQLIPRIKFQPTSDWKSKFPGAFYEYRNGDVADPSVCDDNYWNEAESSLTQVIKAIRESDVASSFMGVHFGQNEWFLDEEDGYDLAPSATEKFQSWLKVRYRNDIVSLRASWYDGSAKFESIQIPDYREGLEGEDFVRTDRRARRWIDYHLFVSDEIVDRIAHMCYAAKAASQGDFLVGTSYGFTFEWSHPFSGHLSLGKLLRCSDLDFCAGPSSYRDREPGGTAAFPFPVDSFALNGKLYMAEEDFRTPISGREDRHNQQNPLMKTPQALESAHWRGVGGALAHEGGVIWMDSNGAGWLNSPGIWERGRDVHNLLAQRLAATPPSPDVAYFIDERSLAYLTDPRAFDILVQQVREALLRSGLSVGFYLLSDLAHRENFPECKIHVFVNAWDIRPEVRSAIKERLQRDKKTLLWLYTAGLFEAGRDSLERVREVTGIALRPQPYNCKAGTTLLNTRDELSQQLDQDELAKGGSLEPSYFAIPETSTILGEYTETGLPSFVIHHFNDGGADERWTSVFLGEPVVSPGLFRALANQNGAHVWSFENDLVHANAPFVTVHCKGTGPRTLMLPDNWVAYHYDLREYVPVENSSVKFKAVDGSTHTFIVGTRGDIDALLNSQPSGLLEVTEPITRNENTLSWDQVNFDVAIMKLDEWMEESWSDELADDLLIKPSMIDQVEEDETTPPQDDDDGTSGRRRKRRRRSPERQRGGESFGQTGVSVLFRKRN